MPTLLRRLSEIGIDFKDLDTSTTPLEDIFVDLVDGRRETSAAINISGVWAIYRSEMAAHAAHDSAERGDAGDHHRALFRGLRRGDRLSHPE